MELTYHGANCVRIATKKSTIVVDDNLKSLVGKGATKPDNVLLQTFQHDISEPKVKMVVNCPGEYEIGDTSIVGVAARAQRDDEKTRSATIYKVIAHDLSVVVAGHIFEDLTDDELENIGHVDVLFIPVGNKGYTLDGTGAMKIIKKIEPKIVIPTHYADKSIKYEVEQDDLTEALKTMSIEVSERVPKLKLKLSDIPEALKLVVLERQ